MQGSNLRRIRVSELRRLVRSVLSERHALDGELPSSGGYADSLEDLDSKMTDKRYDDMAKRVFDAWSERGVDVDWMRVVQIYARNNSKNLATKVDTQKLYEKVLSLVEERADDR